MLTRGMDKLYNSLREGVIVFDLESKAPIFVNKTIGIYTGLKSAELKLESILNYLPEKQSDGKSSTVLFEEIFNEALENGCCERDLLLNLKYRLIFVNVNAVAMPDVGTLVMLFDDTKVPLYATPFEFKSYSDFEYRRFNESKLGSYEYDIQKEEFVLSSVSCQILGIDIQRNKISLQEFKQKVPDLEVENQLEIIKESIEKNSNFELMHSIRIDNEERWLLNWGRPELSSNGEVKVLKGIFQDITEKIDEERKLRYNQAIEKTISTLLSEIIIHNEEDELFRSLIEKMGTMLNFEDCVIYLWNEKEGKLIQKAKFKKGLIRHDNIENLTVPEALNLGEGIVGTVAQNLNSEIVGDVKNDSRYIQEEHFSGSEMAVPLLANNQLIGVIDTEHSQAGFFNQYHLKVLETIAAILAVKIVQVRAREEMFRQEQLLRNTIDSFRDTAVYTVDESFRLLTYNSFYEKLCEERLGIKIKVGTPIEKLLEYSDWRVKMLDAVKMVLSGKEEFVTFVKKSVRNPKDERLIKVGINPVGEGKKPFAVTVMHQDITEQTKHLEAFKKSKERENELKRLLRMRKAENALQFYKGREEERQRIAMRLHDEVANGVAAVILMVENLLGKQADEFIPYLKKINTELRELYEKTRRVSQDLVVSSLDYSDFITEIKEIMHSNLDENTKFHFFIEEAEKLEGLSKHLKSELAIIFDELAVNMAKHAKAKGVNVNMTLEEDRLSIIVEDDGVGFNARDSFKGRGLKKISKRVENMGGTFNIDSVVGTGTTALLELPVEFTEKIEDVKGTK